MILVDPLTAPVGSRRRRWEVWRSPGDQPPWARPALLGIAAVAAFLYAWNITEAGLAPFYSVAVKSMSESWKAFIYGALDPQATITIDKLAGSFWPQALSARIFGFHPWSLALPQVIEGVVSVLVMYRVVRRWAGVVPGLLASAIFTLTPIAASMYGHSMEDGALTMCLVLAADAYQRAVMQARLRSLIWAGVWVGLGFQTKMLQAWMILPALALGYLVAAPARLRRRFWQLGVAGVVMLAVSLSWIALYAFTPAKDRPYVDGSTNNSAVAMVFGYNGLDRFGVHLPGAVESRMGGGGRPPGAGNGAFGTGWTKLLGSNYGPEIGWLYPLAILALVLGLIWTRRAPRTDRARAGLVLWGTWLLTAGLVFSKMTSIPHTAYMATLAPPLAALSAAGITMFWQTYRAGGRRSWILPAAVAAEVAWTLFVWRDYSGFLPWARTALLAAGAVSIIVMVAAKLSRRIPTRAAIAGLTAGVLAMLAAPATWAASVLDTKYGGTSFNASAGPAGGMGGFGNRSGSPSSESPAALAQRYGIRIPQGQDLPGGGPGGSPGGGGMLATTTLTAEQRQIYNYVTTHRDGASYLMAVQSWSQASPYILATGQEVMPMGGFSGSVPQPTLTQVKKLVTDKKLRFFLLDGAGQGPGVAMGRQTSVTVAAIESWVRDACTEIPAADYGATSSAAPSSGNGSAGLGGSGSFGGETGTLYQCHPST